MTSTDFLPRLVGRILRIRWIVRAPIRLYRWHLGALLGHRMLMLEHCGRKTGLPRHVVLEVVDRPSPDGYVIASGFGESGQWYRNVLADPRVRVSVGARRDISAVARPLSDAEVEVTLARYRQAHPTAWRLLAPTLSSMLGSDDLALPMVQLDLSRR